MSKKKTDETSEDYDDQYDGELTEELAERAEAAKPGITRHKAPSYRVPDELRVVLYPSIVKMLNDQVENGIDPEDLHRGMVMDHVTEFMTEPGSGRIPEDVAEKMTTEDYERRAGREYEEWRKWMIAAGKKPKDWKGLPKSKEQEAAELAAREAAKAEREAEAEAKKAALLEQALGDVEVAF